MALRDTPGWGGTAGEGGGHPPPKVFSCWELKSGGGRKRRIKQEKETKTEMEAKRF